MLALKFPNNYWCPRLDLPDSSSQCLNDWFLFSGSVKRDMSGRLNCEEKSLQI